MNKKFTCENESFVINFAKFCQVFDIEPDLPCLRRLGLKGYERLFEQGAEITQNGEHLMIKQEDYGWFFEIKSFQTEFRGPHACLYGNSTWSKLGVLDSWSLNFGGWEF